MLTLRQAIRLVGPENRAKLAILIPLALVVTGAEMLGAVLVYAMLGYATGAAGTVELPLVGDLQDLVGLDGTAFAIALAVTIGIFFVAKAALNIGKTYVQARLTGNMAARLSARIMLGYLRMPYSFHLWRNSSTLIRNTNSAVSKVFGDAISPMIKVIGEVILALGLLFVLVMTSPLATLVAIVVLGLAGLAISVIIHPAIKRLGGESHRLAKATIQTLQQGFHGVRDIKLFGAERAYYERFLRQKKATVKASYRTSVLKALPDNTIELALLGFILAFFAVTVATGTDTPEALTILGLFAYVGQKLEKVVHTIVRGLNDLKHSAVPIDELYADLEMIKQLPAFEDVEPLPFEHSVRVEAVRFRYESSHRDALADVDLALEKGEVFGICGPTGGGKTTLVDVMSGLLEPTEGRVTVDGLDLAEHARAWQRNLGIVPQMIYLTDGSFRENIALAVTDGKVDDDALQEAVDLSQLREFVDSLPNGLETRIGERGVRVSGGQRQRIAIARALYRRPEVLIFDEGTSALDNTTEREVMEALARLRGDHTIVLVAHRLSTVEQADKIAMVKDGRIVALGSYEELLANSRDFAELAGA